MAQLPKCNNKLVVIAHRGNHVNAAENTLLAIQKAIDAGADYVEIDLRTTKDGVQVLMHDGSVNKMTDGKGNINEMMWDDLKRLKVASKNHLDWPSQSIPTFRDVLKLCKGKINIYLDFKDADVKKTYNEIKKAGMRNEVVVYINHEKQYFEWQKTAPKMPLMLSLPDTVKSAEQLSSFLKAYPTVILDGSYKENSREIVNAVMQKSIAIWTDVQASNEGPESWNLALQKGFLGLQTDHPEDLIQYLKSRGLR